MASLKERFEELIHLPWDEFMVMEKDKNTSVDDMVLCSLIRVCADTDNINATKLSFDRIDEIQEVPIKVNVPKFYIRYPNAADYRDWETLRDLETLRDWETGFPGTIS